ncbi:MAG: hypothetical protein II961_09830 [Candidatus Riflebacteria bacterium]|nr:hypothetical protein [Candidatus Riflebacteria bacterium]
MRKVFSMAALMLFMQSTMLMAASGLASYNRQDVTFKYGKTQENVTCVQDATDEKQWYYVSNKPRLAESKNGDPMMMLVSYQKNSKAGIKNDGGILQCGMNLALPADAIPAMKKELAKTVGIPENKIKLGPLDMKNAKIMVYGPGGQLLGDNLTYPEIGPSFANEAIPIQMNLNNLGVPVTEALIKGTGGLQVYYVFDYDALSPEYSVKVTANYDKAFEHFSHDSKSSVPAKKWWFAGASADVSVSTVRENLTQSGAIKIESIGGEKLTDEQIDKLTQPVIEKLMKGIYEIETPEKIEPAKSGDPKEVKGAWINVSTNMAFKSVKTRKTGEFVYDFRKRYIETRKTTVGGILSLAGYTQAQRDAAVQTVDPTYWKNAFYSLPTISKSLNGIDEMTVTVNFLYKGKQAEGTEQQLAKWTKKEGWVDAKKEECIGLEFPLKYFYDKYSKNSKTFADDITYQQNFEVTYMEGNNTKVKKFSTTVPAFTGDIPISTPMVGVTYIEFEADEDSLTWDKAEYEGGEFDGLKSNLTKIGIKMESKTPKNTGNATLTSKNPNACFWFDNNYDKKTGKYEIPQVSATYTFYNSKLAKAMDTKDKKTIVIENDDALSEGTSITFMNDDYMPIEKPASYK